MDSLTASLTVGVVWNAGTNVSGHAQRTNQTALSKNIALGTSAANNAAGGANSVYSALLSINASSSTTLDLTSVTDILGNSLDFARVKAIVIRLLASTETDPSGTAIGSAATSVTIDNTVTNALSAQSHTGWFDNANEGTSTGGMGDATGSKFTIPNGGWMGFGVGNAAGVVVDSTHKALKITNNDSGVAAKVLVTILGGTT